MENLINHNESDRSSRRSSGNSTRETPPLERSGGPRISIEVAASTSQPVELIDLSNINININIPRLVTGVIDLCTPPRVTGYINLSDPDEQPTNGAQRARRRTRSTGAIDPVDGTSAEGPSPPKHARPDLNVSSDALYKCPVCMDDVRQREPNTTRCGHIFCKECIVTAVQSTHKCPLCNKKITLRQLIRLYF